MTDESNPRELEWYNLETRMRDLLYTQLEKVISNSKKDRELVMLLKKKLDKSNGRVKELESAVFKKKAKDTVLEEIETKLVQLEGNRLKDMVRIDQELANFKGNIKSVEFTVMTCVDTVNRLEDQTLRQGDEVQNFREVLNQHQTVVMDQLKILDENFKMSNKTYIEFVKQAEERSTQAYNKGANNQTEILNLRKVLDASRKEIFEGLNEFKKFKEQKLDVEEFVKHQQVLKKNLTTLQEQIDQIFDDIEKRDIFLDRYYIMRVYKLISDALHSCISESTKKKYCAHESNRIKELNTDVYDKGQTVVPRDIATSIILDEFKSVEIRKNNILTDDRRMAVLDIPIPSMFSQDNASISASDYGYEMDSEHNRNGMGPEEIEKEVYRVANDIWVIEEKKLKTQIENAFGEYKKEMSSQLTQVQLYSQSVLGEVEVLSREKKKEKSEAQVEITQISKEIQDIQDDISSIGETVSGMAQMIACIVENSQIDMALTNQEEESKRPVSSKNATKVTPDSLTIFGTAKRPSSTQSPARQGLLYRAKLYSRDELIQLKGRMIKNCWEAVSQQLPWKQKEFDKVIDEVAKRPRKPPVTIAPSRIFDSTLREIPDMRPKTTQLRTRKQYK